MTLYSEVDVTASSLLEHFNCGSPRTPRFCGLQAFAARSRFEIGKIPTSMMQIRREYCFSAVTLEIHTHYCTILHLTSCILLSRCTSQVKCCERRLRCLIELQTFLLSNLQITPIVLYFGEFPSFLVHCNPGFGQVVMLIGLTVVKCTACLPFLRLVHPGLNPD